MEINKINLCEYRLSGQGATGESYDCLTDPDVMVKLFNIGIPLEPIHKELEVARKVFDMGVPSPEPGEMVTDGYRIGIRFRRIVGKRSFSRMLSDEPQRTEEFSREFARLSKKLHSMECPNGLFPDQKVLILDALSKSSQYTNGERMFLLKLIDGMPQANKAVHGDLHIGNVISTLPKGAPLSTPHQSYFIDLGFFSQGHPIFDVAGVMGNLYFSSGDYITRELHITVEHAKEVFNYFLDEYFFAEDRIADKWFGPGQTMDSVKEQLRKAYVVRFITVTYVIGRKLPEYEETLHSLMSGGQQSVNFAGYE